MNKFMSKYMTISKRQAFTVLALPLACAALTACASLTPPRTETPIIGADIPSSWLLDLPSSSGAPLTWSALYDDPLLIGYMQQAATENFDIKTAQARVVNAQAVLRRVKAGLKPQASANASAAGSAFLSDIDTPSDSYGLSFSGRWDPDVFGQTRTLIEGSEANLNVQKALAADTRQAIMASTGRAYISAVEAALLVDLAKTNLEFLTESRRISEARYRLGDTAKGDFSFAEANYQSALVSYENTVQAARAARRALSILLGGYPDESLRLAPELKTPNALPNRELPTATLQRRPDIIAARAQLAGRVAALQSSRLARWPDIGLSGGLSAGSSFSNLFDPGDYIAQLASSLSQILFDGGAITANIDASKADLEIAVLSYEQRLRRAAAEITNAFDRADTLKRTLVNLESSSTAANEALRLESIQFNLGESSLLDVLQVQTRVNAIDASLIRTKASLLETLIAANEAVAGF